MPANETFWRNLRTMHIVFAVSAAALFVATLWMMWADHADPWREYQATFDKIDAAKLAQAEEWAENEAREKTADLKKELAAEEKALEERRPEIEKLQSRIDQLQYEVDLATRDVRNRRAFRDKARADFDLAVSQERGEDVLRRLEDAYKAEQQEVDRLELVLQQKEDALKKAQNELKEITRRRDELQAEMAKAQSEVERLRKAREKIAPKPESWTDVGPMFAAAKREVMQWPIIDGFNSPRQIKMRWLPDLKITLGMARTARFDRCETCHVGIDRVEAGNVPAFPHGHPKSEEIADWVKENKFPHPFATHPNPDLYLTPSSPHPASTFGCTICHEGQGSGTDFANAAHSPNNPHIEQHWEHEHGFAYNHFWEYPMLPTRFEESSCIKCHHNVTELAVNPRFGATAPKVHRGLQLIEQYGCFGCHEVHGFDAGKPIGPDLRLEPNYYAAALQVLSDPALQPKNLDGNEEISGLSLAEIRNLAQTVADRPAEAQAERRKLRDMVLADKALEQPLLSMQSHNLADELKDVEQPGQYRKVGPALRHVDLKTTRDWLEYWVEEPKRFRPETNMPQFFKLTNQQDPHALEFQPVEIAGIAEYLLDKSQPLDLLQPQDGYEPNAERGKYLFSRRGCLACHSHGDFPEIKSDFGPKLDRVHEKVREGEQGFNWLYTWIRDPHRYDKRTKMPVLFIEPYQEDGELVDPAADIAAYLLQGPSGEQAGEQPVAQLDEPAAPSTDEHAHGHGEPVAFKESIDEDLEFSQESLDKLVKLYLSKVLTNSQVEDTLTSRKYPIGDRSLIKGDEIELSRDAAGAEQMSDEEWRRMKLNYIGRRTISRYGCYGCHDIPGFENARPIGTALQDWGRKDTSKLALEHIEEWLHHHGEPDGSSTRQRVARAMHKARAGEWEQKIEKLESDLRKLQEQLASVESSEAKAQLQQKQAEVRQQLEAVRADREGEMSAAYFVDSLLHHGRPGFLWQKLRQPRSYDYLKVDTKGYDERLRMPKFPVSEDEIEAIATFVLGLVAEPPASQYVYRPQGPEHARIAGEGLLQKYNCTSCHMIDPPAVSYAPEGGIAGLIRGATVDELTEWAVRNREKILQGNLQPDDYRLGEKSLQRDVELITRLGANFDQIVKLTYDKNEAKMRENLKQWFAEHPEVLLTTDLRQPEESIAAVRHLLKLKPPESGETGRTNDKGEEIVRFHGMLNAAPDPEEPDPEFRFYSFQLTNTLEAGGRVLLPGSNMAFNELQMDAIGPARGGDFALWLVDSLSREPGTKTYNSRSKSWESSPPPLLLEGHKVQTSWLFQFLKNPDRIRHETVLRMPRFNMSDEEARTLANYFAAVDGAEYPYQQIPQQEPDYLSAAEQMLTSRNLLPAEDEYLPAAWQVLSQNALCAGCHAVAGREFQVGPNPDQVTHGPDLRNVSRRLRPDYLQLWLYKPAWVLPYTSMPAPGSKPMDGILGADAQAQALALRDALLNYHQMMEREAKPEPLPAAPLGDQPAANQNP